MLRPGDTGGERDLEAFWRGVGERRGGEVTFTTFATYLGRAGERPLVLPGLLYRVGDRFWFEDVPRDSWLLRIVPPRRPFAKTEIAFERSGVAFRNVVSRNTAYRCMAGRVAPGAAATLGRIERLYAVPVVQVGLADGGALFFEAMRERELVAELG